MVELNCPDRSVMDLIDEIQYVVDANDEGESTNVYCGLSNI